MPLTLSNYNQPDCSEPLDRANTCEQELGKLIAELRQFVQTCRENAGFDNPEEILAGMEEILNGD